MELNVYCPIWGLVPDYIDRITIPLEPVLAQIKRAGYDGVEMAIPLDNKQKKELGQLLLQFDLKIIALQWAASANNLKQYIKEYESHILSAVDLNPVWINAHTGSDYFSFSDNCEVIEKAFELESNVGIEIIHETHRSRFTFHPYHIQSYLKAYPQLKLAADFSHWCVVSESLLENRQEQVKTAIQHSVHVHARIGFAQGAQVSDPRAPEFKEATNRHLEWWDEIFQSRKDNKASVMTITPEFGPYPYMPAKPFTKEPLASQWDLNLWMMDQLKQRYQYK